MMDDYKAIFKYSEEVEAMTKVLIESCKLHKFDGFVFEVWSQIAGAVKPESAVKLISTMSMLMLINYIRISVCILCKQVICLLWKVWNLFWWCPQKGANKNYLQPVTLKPCMSM